MIFEIVDHFVAFATVDLLAQNVTHMHHADDLLETAIY